jgi:hypothetical protein
MTRRSARWPLGAAVILLLTLNGCGRVLSPVNTNNSVLEMPAAARQASANAGPRLAVGHRFTLLVPNAQIEALQQKHIAECTKLGCSILSMSINRSDHGPINAGTSVRIKPEAYDAFAASLAEPPAKITHHSQTADDLAMPTLDSEKRLAAKTTLRERLTALLNDQNTKTAADLITIEKELSQAQGEIEAMTAQLDNLRRRTDTVSIDVTYVGTTAGYGEIDLTPLHEAVIGIGQTVVRSLSWLIYCLAAVGPWLPIIAIVWWVVRRSVRRWRSNSVT